MLQSINPYTRAVIANWSRPTESDVEQGLEQIVNAQTRWAQLPLNERRMSLHKIAEILQARQSEVAHCIATEMGKPLDQALAEVSKSLSAFNYYLALADDQITGQCDQTTVGAKGSYVYGPVGVVLAIMPWNFPLWQVVRFAVPGLLAGNAIVLKHADSVQMTAELIQSIFNCTQDGVLKNLRLSHQQIEKVIADPRVHAVTFTGSTAAGQAVAGLAGRNLKKGVFELGGSDAYIVLEDADLSEAIRLTVQSRMQNSGQSCVAAKRLLVPQHCLPDVVDLLKLELQKITFGDPLTSPLLGPLASQIQLQRMEELTKLFLNSGASTIATRSFEHPAAFSPSALLIDGQNPLLQDSEFFAPVLLVSVYRTEDEAVKLANWTHFGLGAAVFSNDLVKAHQIAHRVQAGMVAINCAIESRVELPFGGIKNSGYGRELSLLGLRELQVAKSYLQSSK